MDQKIPQDNLLKDLAKDPVIEQVMHDYEKTVVVPSSKPQPQFILCPIGLVGAGKTTVVKPLAAKLSLVRISGDEIRKLLKENGRGYEKVSEIAFFFVKKYLESGYSVAIDSDCVSEKTQEFVRIADERYGIKPVWIHVTAPEGFIFNKFRNHAPSWLFANPEEAIKNYEERKPLHEHLAMPFVYTFDTSRSDLPKQIDEGVEIIGKKIDH